MRVRFWGTRGSLPVALTAEGVRDKLKAVLRAARGHRLDSDADIDKLLLRLTSRRGGQDAKFTQHRAVKQPTVCFKRSVYQDAHADAT